MELFLEVFPREAADLAKWFLENWQERLGTARRLDIQSSKGPASLLKRSPLAVRVLAEPWPLLGFRQQLESLIWLLDSRRTGLGSILAPRKLAKMWLLGILKSEKIRRRFATREERKHFPFVTGSRFPPRSCLPPHSLAQHSSLRVRSIWKAQQSARQGQRRPGGFDRVLGSSFRPWRSAFRPWFAQKALRLV